MLGEARRVLRRGGTFAFSSLCVGTLQELRDSWQAVDGFTHVNRFRTLDTYQRLCRDSGLQLLGLEVRPEVLHFADLRQLTHELKALGAHNLNPGRRAGSPAVHASARWSAPTSATAGRRAAGHLSGRLRPAAQEP